MDYNGYIVDYSGLTMVKVNNDENHGYPVGGFNPSENMSSSDWIIIPAIGENKQCSKPPTR